jgi:SAM-dependent methyltransferase
MIDVGGSHGYYSVALCRGLPHLRSAVLDLPEAINAAAPLLAAEKMGDRVVYREGNALAYDFGVEAFDLVLLSHLAHHFSASQNAELFQWLGRALRPRGVLAVIEPIRPENAGAVGQFAALSGLYFGLTSRSGTWTIDEIARWQLDAGLNPTSQPIMLSTGNIGVQTARSEQDGLVNRRPVTTPMAHVTSMASVLERIGGDYSRPTICSE